jgi:hypothetical protein
MPSVRRTTVWALAAIAAIGLLAMVAGPFVVREAFRYYAVQKALSKIPYAEERLAVFPKTRTLTASTPVQPVNLGYATFDMGTNGPIYIAADGGRGMVVITNADFGFRLTAPYAIDGLTNIAIAADASGSSHLASFVEMEATDMVAAQVEVEKTRILPIFQIALMSKDDFSLYTFKLISKAALTWGNKETWSFMTPHIKGIARVGMGPDDREHVWVNFASLDGTRNLAMEVFLLHGSHKDVVPALDPILASFQFTIDKIYDRDEITRLILQAGIPMRPTKH